LFQGIDWKFSSIKDSIAEIKCEPFPDLKVVVVREIVGSGHAIRVDDIPKFGGKHLTPEEFHAVLEQGWSTSSLDDDDDDDDKKRKELVVIDVRNQFEYAIGHFVHPSSASANNDRNTNYEHDDNIRNQEDKVAINPKMVTFASFDTSFCEKNAESLKDKKVLMYCTGGIRCEKASAMLRKRGVQDVSQLSGGIHRYLEQFGSGGFFKGKNFVFDQRVAMEPEDVDRNEGGDGELTHTDKDQNQNWVVGKCLECKSPFDEISGSRLCTVCRDLVLICRECQQKLREYHCDRHSSWKKCYFTFLEAYDKNELKAQEEVLTKLRDSTKIKNIRRTLLKQIHKIHDRIKLLESGQGASDKNAPKRCRTCHEEDTMCDGLCWGFWRQSGREPYKSPINT